MKLSEEQIKVAVEWWKDVLYNPKFDTERIHCRGPYLIVTPERKLNFGGHLEQWDTLIVYNNKFSIDGVPMFGMIEEAAIWQVARGYMREIDNNLGLSFSANGTLN